MRGERARAKTPTVTRTSRDLGDGRQPPGVHVFSEEAEADGHGHQGLCDGQGWE